MNRRISLVSCLLVFTLFLSCKKETVGYNQKANEVILQLMIDESCGCISEIPKEAMTENDSRFIPVLIDRLHLRDRKELDSLVRLSDNYILDSTFLKKHKIKVENNNSINDPNFCEGGILIIGKPIFDKEYKNALIKVGQPFVCSPPYWAMYKLENRKWKK